jgi:hypothetical protein
MTDSLAQLRTFELVARTGSLTGAARTLGVMMGQGIGHVGHHVERGDALLVRAVPDVVRALRASRHWRASSNRAG